MFYFYKGYKYDFNEFPKNSVNVYFVDFGIESFATFDTLAKAKKYIDLQVARDGLNA